MQHKDSFIYLRRFVNLVIESVFEQHINPLTPELNPSAQRCLKRFLLGILLLEPYISLIHA
jgi:hypothetical protein